MNYKPVIKVETRKRPTHLQLSIQDNGEGIFEHLQDRIFEPFFTTRKDQGDVDHGAVAYQRRCCDVTPVYRFHDLPRIGQPQSNVTQVFPGGHGKRSHQRTADAGENPIRSADSGFHDAGAQRH